MSDKGRNPYEIRTELLHLSRAILCDRTNEAVGSKRASPTTEEIIAEAKKLNDFVSSDTTKSKK